VTKGDDPGDHGYSAFDGHLPGGQPLKEALAAAGVRRLIVAGLATDYCVKHSALDARRAGLEVTLVADAVRGVDVSPGDSDAAVRELMDAGVQVVKASALVDDRTPAGGSQSAVV
jgi:nicotinamidase/pyrazinamidase